MVARIRPQDIEVAFKKTNASPGFGVFAIRRRIGFALHGVILRSYQDAGPQAEKYVAKMTCACGIGVMCLAEGVEPEQIDSATLSNYRDVTTTYIDGFICGWDKMSDPDKVCGDTAAMFALTEEEETVYHQEFMLGRDDGLAARHYIESLGKKVEDLRHLSEKD